MHGQLIVEEGNVLKSNYQKKCSNKLNEIGVL